MARDFFTRVSPLLVLFKGWISRLADIKPSNILVNYTSGDLRFSEVQHAYFESTVHVDSSHARNSDPIGTPIFRSPEAHLRMRWGTATDIWSFGATVSGNSPQNIITCLRISGFLFYS